MLEGGYSKQSADLFTFWIWAAIQEYVFTAVTGCFYPILLTSCIIFGLLFYSVPFIDSTKSTLKYYDDNHIDSGIWNVLLWIMLFLQNGFFVTLYAREWYCCQIYKHIDNDTWIPYSWQIERFQSMYNSSNSTFINY